MKLVDGESVTEALTDLYAEIVENGYWVKEFLDQAHVGRIEDVIQIAQDREISQQEAHESLTRDDVRNISAPGRGIGRVERVRAAYEMAMKYHENGWLPATTREHS